MRVTCPKCGCTEEIDAAEIGDLIECSCGTEFAFGQVEVAANAFVNGIAAVFCPFCGQMSFVQSNALNSNVQCGACNERFRVIGSMPPPPNKKSGLGCATLFALSVILCLGAYKGYLIYQKKTIAEEYERLNDWPKKYKSLDYNLHYNKKDFSEKFYFIDAKAYPEMKVLSIVKGGFFSNEEGILAYTTTFGSEEIVTIYIRMNPEGMVDGMRLPEMFLVYEGTFTYSATFGNTVTVPAFRLVE